MIQFPCTRCGRLLATPDHLAGTAVRCPQCAQVLQVRRQGPPPAAVPPAAIPVAPPPSPVLAQPSWPNLWTPAAILLGILALPVAVAAGKPLVGLIVLGIGLGLAVAGLVVSVARQGAGLGLGLTAVAVCVSGLYVAAKLPGDAPRPPPGTGREPALARNDRPGEEKPPPSPEKTPSTRQTEKSSPPPPEPADPVPPPKTDEQTAARALERLNRHRRQAGLSPVMLDEELSKACKAHAVYLARHHDNPRTRALGPHKEDSSLEGYSPEGEQAGRNGVIYTVATNIDPRKYDPSDVEAVDSLLSTFYHRIPLLSPDLRQLGFGYAVQTQGKNSVWVTVMDIRDSRRPDGARGWVVLYPGAGQEDVPTTFHNHEQPNPTPPEGFGKPLGYCVTATFARGTKVEDAEATLADGAGAPLAAWVSTPTRPAGASNVQQNTVCLIAKAPLKPRTAYTATLTARVDGKDWKRSWTFTTGAE